MKNLIGKSISKNDINKYLKYCNRYSLIINLIGTLIVLPLVIYYRFYHDGLKYDYQSFYQSIKQKRLNEIHQVNVMYQDNKKEKNARNLYILYFIGCLYLISTIIDTYIRIFHKDNKYVKMWVGYSCFGDIISLLF